ncbi:MAG TPA: carboxypeptidase-like regulatory domain-containing protein [Gemmatimonadaceae bacterium]|nr:carboxypeptidase-like regulatory domain-containing protein [Gemmatimonadaceae bacterium]
MAHNQHMRACRAAAFLVSIGLALAACDRKPPTTPPPPPVGPAPVQTVRLEIVAPAEIEPGESVQLTANAIKSDGSVENVSSQARWSPTNSPILQLSPTGLATGIGRGYLFVTAVFANRSVGARILVLPRGTFVLTGNIKESGFGVPGVAVTVISGIGTGLTTLTNLNGDYVLYGVSGPVQIQLKKEGYLTTARQVDVAAHGTRDFELAIEGTRKNYAGRYTLTISTNEPCRSKSGILPEEAKRRVYTANVTQDAGRLTVLLTDADFIVTNGFGNRFFALMDPLDTMTATIGNASDYYYYTGHFDIVERLSATTLMVQGTVTAKGTPQGISGTLNGAFLTSNRPTAPFLPSAASCYSTHGFEMVRR